MCRSGCKTQDHASWGECVRASHLSVASVQTGYYRRWDKELKDYDNALAQGIQPTSTHQRDIDMAVQLSNEVGEAI